MKKILILLFVLSLNNQVFAAGSDSSSDSGSETSLYDQAVKLVKRAGKLEKKDKGESKKTISQAFKKLNKAYKSDKKNPDILNYMGFTSRKIGNFKEAENYYLKGLES